MQRSWKSLMSGTVVGLCFLVNLATAQTAERLYQAGMVKYNARDYRGAVKDAEAAAQADPQHWQAWQLSGNARYALGDKQGALAVYEYSLQINPNNPQLQNFSEKLRKEIQPTAPTPSGTPSPIAAAALPDAVQKSWRVGAWAGYAGVDLGDVEAARGSQEIVESFVNYFGGSATSKTDDVKGGIIFGAEIGYQLTPSLGLGGKVGIIQPADLTSELTATGASNESVKSSETLSMSLVPLLVGGWVEGGESVGPHYRGSLFLGPAFGLVNQKFSFSHTDPTGTDPDEDWLATMSYTGNAFAFEVGAGAGYGFSETVSLFVDILYLSAKVKEMKATDNLAIVSTFVAPIKKGEADSDFNDKAVPYDFSGLHVRVGVRIAF